MTGWQMRPEVHDLSLLSLLAAHEIERLERREPSDGQYLSALRDHLAHQVDPAGADIKNIAPSTVQLYRRAIRDATQIDPPDFSALVKELDRLLNLLQLASDTTSKDRLNKNGGGDLKALLAFVISIHSQLLAQKQRIASSRSSTKYKA
jgi:hypothetical protein